MRISDWSSDVCSSDLPPRHHCWREEIVAQKKSQSIADSILVAWNDGRMGNRQTKRMTKQRRHRKPISKAAHHRRLGEGADETHRRMDTLHAPRGDVDRGHQNQDRKSVVEGKSVSVRVDPGGR